MSQKFFYKSLYWRQYGSIFESFFLYLQKFDLEIPDVTLELACRMKSYTSETPSQS